MGTSHQRSIAENMAGSVTPSGDNWLRRAVERTGADVSGVVGSWAKKLFVALGGDPASAIPGGWMKNIAYLLGAEANEGSWEAKVALAIEQGGGITHPTFDSDVVTWDSDHFSWDNQ